MQSGKNGVAWAALCLAVGCGGSCPQAESASSGSAQSGTDETGAKDNSAPADSESGSSSGSTGDTSGPSPAKETAASGDKAGSAEPSFPENASVAQAMAAVPQGTARANIDPDVLGAPLENVSLYAPCKVGSQHFKLRVAVWGGHAVGIDITTPNAKLADCVKTQVRAVEWRDKVQSLNTVEFSM